MGAFIYYSLGGKRVILCGVFIANKKPHRNLMDLKFSDYIEVEEIFSGEMEPNFSRSPLELNVLCLIN